MFRYVTISPPILMKLLAIRPGHQETMAKSLVIIFPLQGEGMMEKVINLMEHL